MVGPPGKKNSNVVASPCFLYQNKFQRVERVKCKKQTMKELGGKEVRRERPH